MLNVGFGELIVITILLLVVVGPERLPAILRTVGRYYGMLRRTTFDLQRAFLDEVDRLPPEQRALDSTPPRPVPRAGVGTEEVASGGSDGGAGAPVDGTASSPREVSSSRDRSTP